MCVWQCSKHFDFSQRPHKVVTSVRVELGLELSSATVKASIHKYFLGKEDLLVELAGSSDPSLKLGWQLRGPAISTPFLGLTPSGLWGSDHPQAVTDEREAELPSPEPPCHLLSLMRTESCG